MKFRAEFWLTILVSALRQRVTDIDIAISFVYWLAEAFFFVVFIKRKKVPASL